MIDNDLLIFGAGLHAQKLASALQKCGYSVIGFVVSKISDSTHIKEIPIYTWESLPADFCAKYQFACGIFNRSDSYEELNKIICMNNVVKILWPWQYYPLLSRQLGWCYWLNDNCTSISKIKNDISYSKLHSTLADQESKNILNRVIEFRSGNDLAFSAFNSNDLQYFNNLTLNVLPSNRAIKYLDVGAYTGDTLEQLLQHIEVSKAVLVEPEPLNCKSLIDKVSILGHKYPTLNSYVFPIGAGAKFESISLSGHGEASTLRKVIDTNESSERNVTIAPLDFIIPNDSFDFIKIDVEGYDLEALSGMKELLKRSSAVLAISVYHRAFDIVDLPIFVMELLEGLPYKFYLRQHMNNSFDTVFYAVPFKI